MKTRTLVLKELDYDCLPLDGTQIVFFDSHTQMGMFEQLGHDAEYEEVY